MKDVYTSGTSEILAKKSLENLVYDEDGNINAIQFVYPIVATVDLGPARESPIPVVTCGARRRLEQRLELVLTGAVPTMVPVARLREKTPADGPRKTPDSTVRYFDVQ